MRLIDADELKTLYDDAEFVGEKWRVPIRVILANNDDMPTIDPVKHGRWIEHHYVGGVYFRCSNCNAEGYGRYCQNCGAYMKYQEADEDGDAE